MHFFLLLSMMTITFIPRPLNVGDMVDTGSAFSAKMWTKKTHGGSETRWTQVLHVLPSRKSRSAANFGNSGRLAYAYVGQYDRGKAILHKHPGVQLQLGLYFIMCELPNTRLISYSKRGTEYRR